jgi:hypothetical protein
VDCDYLMADYTPQTWTDDDGSGTVGTVFTKARMDTIEAGVQDAAQHNTRGLLASRPAAAAGNKGWLYLATDVGLNGKVFHSDGATWSPSIFDDTVHVTAATKAALPTYTKTGNVLTASANGALSVDGLTFSLNDLILVKNQNMPSGISVDNGVYKVTQLGDASNPWKLTRIPGWDTGDLVRPGRLVSVGQSSLVPGPLGTGHSQEGVWTLRGSSNPITVNTNASAFTPAAQQVWTPKPCRVATTAAVTISTALNVGDVIDGVTLADGDRVLVKDQTDQTQNCIYIAGSTPVRASEMYQEIISGTVVSVSEGDVNADTRWMLLTNAPITVDVTSMVFGQLGGSGAVRAKETWSSYRSAALSLATGGILQCDTEEFDPANIHDAVTNKGRVTPTRPGVYRVSGRIQKSTPLSAATKYWIAVIYKNGVAYKYAQAYSEGTNNNASSVVSGLVYCNGSTDYIELAIEHNETGSVALSASAATAYFQGEFVAADMAGSLTTPKFRAKRTSNGSAIASLASAILYSSKDWDTNNNFDPTTGKFTAPVAGKYHFDATILGAGTYATTTFMQVELWKNGAAYSAADYKPGMNVGDADFRHIADDIVLAAGDTVEVPHVYLDRQLYGLRHGCRAYRVLRPPDP